MKNRFIIATIILLSYCQCYAQIEHAQYDRRYHHQLIERSKNYRAGGFICASVGGFFATVGIATIIVASIPNNNANSTGTGFNGATQRSNATIAGACFVAASAGLIFASIYLFKKSRRLANQAQIVVGSNSFNFPLRDSRSINKHQINIGLLLPFGK